MNAAIQRAFEQGLGDAEVRAISWTDDDLLLNLDLPGLPVRNLCLCFKMIAKLKLDFDFGDYVGRPLVFSAEAQEIGNGKWEVRFGFGVAPEGTIEFECTEICECPAV